MKTIKKYKIPIFHISILIFLFVLEIYFVTKGGYYYGNMDDWNTQHVQLPDYLRQLFYSTGKLFPDFAMNLGMGQNIYYIAYYGLFSPIILISYLLPNVPMITYMQISAIIMTMASIVLIYRWLNQHLPIQESFLAALFFTLAVPIMYHSHHHLMFVNYMPFLILALEGCERYFKKNQKNLLVISVLCIILCSYYFSVSCIVALGLYWIYLYLESNQKILFKTFIKEIIRLIKIMILPVLMSAVLWLPILYILSEGRASTSTTISIKDLLLPAFQSSSIVYGHDGLGVSAIFLLSIAGAVFSKKRAQKYLGIVFALFMSFGIGIYVLNAGMYIDGKVLIPFVPMAALLFGTFLEETHNHEYDIHKFFLCASLMMVFAALRWTGTSTSKMLFLVDAILCISIYVILYHKRIQKQAFTFLFVLMLIPAMIANGFNNYSDPLLKKTEDLKTQYTSDTTALLKQAANKEKTLVRTDLYYKPYYSANYVVTPWQLRTSLYSSLSNSTYRQFFYKEAGNNINWRSNAAITPSKNLMNALMTGTKYIVGTHKKAPLPEYTEIAKKGKLRLFENNEAVPFGYVSNSDVEEFEPDWKKLSCKQLEESIKTHADVYQEGKKLEIVLKKQKKINIPIAPSSTNRIIVVSMHVDNSWYKTSQPIDSRIGEIHLKINKVKNVLSSPNWKYNNHNNDFTFSIMVHPGVDHLTLTLGKGDYLLSDFYMESFDFAQYQNWRKTLSEWHPYKESDNIMKGKIHVQKTGNMIINVPYDDGFTVTVDGKKVRYRKSENTMIEIPIQKGNHQVKVEFHAPLKKAGIVISILGWVFWIVTIIWNKKEVEE